MGDGFAFFAAFISLNMTSLFLYLVRNRRDCIIAHEFGNSRFDGFSPEAVSFLAGMLKVGHEGLDDGFIRPHEDLVDVEIEDVLIVGEFCGHVIGLGETDAFIPRFLATEKDAQEKDLHIREFLAQFVNDGGDATANFLARIVSAIVLANHDDGEFRGDAVEVAMLDPPEDVFSAVAADAEVGRVAMYVISVPDRFPLVFPIFNDGVANPKEIDWTIF